MRLQGRGVWGTQEVFLCWERAGNGPGVRVGATVSERICQIGDHDKLGNV